jgi:hypothetical protein
VFSILLRYISSIVLSADLSSFQMPKRLSREGRSDFLRRLSVKALMILRLSSSAKVFKTLRNLLFFDRFRRVLRV